MKITTAEKIKEEIKNSMTVAKGSFYKRPEFGHRFGELKRAVATEATRRRAEDFAREALEWLVRIGHIAGLAARAVYSADNKLFVTVSATITATGENIEFSRFVEVGHA
jgi:phage gp46-like protein